MTNAPDVARTNAPDNESLELREPVRAPESSTPPLLESVSAVRQQIEELFQAIKKSESRLAGIEDSIKRVGFTPRVTKLLARQVHELGSQPEEILLKALSLFSRAVEAERAGQRIAILDPDDTIVAEIGGFEAPLTLSTAS